MKKKIALVARVSTVDKQDYNRQIDDLTTEIKKHGHTDKDIEIFADKISGYSKNEKRPEFSKLLSRLDEFQSIYVTEISRLGREPSEVRKTIDELCDLKIPIYVKSLNKFTIDECGKRDSVMSIIIQVLIEFANDESRLMKERSKSGLLRSARQGRAGGGASIAYGYKRDTDKMLVIELDEALIISKLFDMYSKGKGLKAIANYLNENNVPTRSELKYKVKGHGWHDAVVLTILKNPLYKGERQFKGETISAPPIITPELFKRCKDIREGKTHRNYMTTYEYLLKDLIVCGCCSSNYYARFKPTDRGDKVYVCSSNIRKNVKSLKNCTNTGVNISLIESAIYDQLLKSERILPHLSQVKEMLNDMKEDLVSTEEELVKSEKLIKEKEMESKRLITLYTTGIITDLADLEQAKKNIDSSLKRQGDRISMLKMKKTQLKISIENNSNAKVNQNLLIQASKSRSELKAIFNQFIEKVIVNEVEKGLIMASVFIKVDGIVLKKPLKLFLDKQVLQTKRKNKPYRYLPFSSLVNEPVFSDVKLISEQSEIVEEIKSELKFKPWIDCETILTVL